MILGIRTTVLNRSCNAQKENNRLHFKIGDVDPRDKDSSYEIWTVVAKQWMTVRRQRVIRKSIILNHMSYCSDA